MSAGIDDFPFGCKHNSGCAPARTITVRRATTADRADVKKKRAAREWPPASVWRGDDPRPL